VLSRILADLPHYDYESKDGDNKKSGAVRLTNNNAAEIADWIKKTNHLN